MNSNGAPRPVPPALARAGDALLAAFAFLTIVPLGRRGGGPSRTSVADSRFAYPLVGLVIGGILAGLSTVFDDWRANPGLSAFLILAVWVLITGGLHLDGLADTMDGLYLWGGAEQRLKVMRDPHVGSFGVIALVLVLLGKFAALTSLDGSPRALGILGAVLVGRLVILVSAGTAPYARAEGTGRIVVDATTQRDAAVAAAALIVAGFACARLGGLFAGILLAYYGWMMTRVFVSKLGGVTGDTLGALVELGELGFLAIVSLPHVE